MASSSLNLSPEFLKSLSGMGSFSPFQTAKMPADGNMTGDMPLDKNKLIGQVLNPRLDVAGHSEDPTAPTGIDWLSAHGPSAHSWDASQPHATSWNGPQAAMADNMHSRGVEAGFTPFGEASAHYPIPGEAPNNPMISGVPADQFFVQHEHPGLAPLMNNGTGTPQQFAHDYGMNLPRHATAPNPEMMAQHTQQSMPDGQERQLIDKLGMGDILTPHVGRGGLPPISSSPFGGAPSAPPPQPAPTPRPQPTAPQQQHFSPFSQAITEGTSPIPETGVVPAALSNAGTMADNSANWLMEKLFGSPLHGQAKMKTAVSPHKTSFGPFGSR